MADGSNPARCGASRLLPLPRTASGGVISRLLAGGDVDEIRGQQIQVELEIEGADSLAALLRDLSALENVTGVEVDDDD